MCAENSNRQAISEMVVLYKQLPIDSDPRFILIERWETVDGIHSRLIVEYSTLVDGELEDSKSIVVPFHWTVEQVLNHIKDNGLFEAFFAHATTTELEIVPA